MSERYIERSFPIVQLNPLSRRERNAFKPIYKMHKWFARRSSSIFRAILLGAALPYEGEDGEVTDLMAEFYEPHGEDARLTNAKGERLTVLDPFMGGGTTVVEALRLGFSVTGIDLNPIAWFIVKGETTAVDLDELQKAFERVGDKVKERLLGFYKTECPVSKRADGADIIYGFWVKQGICVAPECGEKTDLFKSYEVARKRGECSLHYWADVECPRCEATFDWELDRCTITAGGPQVQGDGAHGRGRPADTRYAYGDASLGVECPCCGERVKQRDLKSEPAQRRKKVPLHVLVDPSTGDFFEVRGKMPAEVTAPVSGFTFRPADGPAARGEFACGACGRVQAIVESADAHGEPLPFRYYGFYALSHTVDSSDKQTKKLARALGLPTNNYKWFGAVTKADLARVAACEADLQVERDGLPLPTQEIYDGYNTNRLVIHQYKQWTDLYGPRQLLALGLLLRAIGEEQDAALRDALLGAFQSHLDSTSLLTSLSISTNKARNVTAAHDFRNPTTSAENNIWGVGRHGMGTYSNTYEKLAKGIWFQSNQSVSGASSEAPVPDVGSERWSPELHKASADRNPCTGPFDLVITDPPYAGSVQYAEMSDFFYVWLHHVLKDHYAEFEPEITLKSQEIIEDSMRKDADWYFKKLTAAWAECHRVLKDDGLLVFTFHHKEGDRWAGLLRSLFDAGFYLVAAYPTHSEALNSIVIQATKGITYDIVHVCRKRTDEPETIPWAVLRSEVRSEASAKLREIEAGGDVLPGPDVWMILLGTALRLFSQHYGAVLDQEGEPLSIEEGIQRLGVVVREVRGEVAPLTQALQSVDVLSQVWLMHVVGHEGWQRDGLHMELRAYAYSVDDLEAVGLVVADADDRGAVSPIPLTERYTSRQASLDGSRSLPLVDKLTQLIGEYEAGTDVNPLIEGWRGYWLPLEEGVKLIAKRDAALRDTCERIARLFDGREDEGLPALGAQGSLGLGGDDT